MRGPKNLKPIPSNLVRDWDEPGLDIHTAKRKQMYNWRCRIGPAGAPGCGYAYRNSISFRLSYETGCPRCPREARKRPITEKLRKEWAEDFPIEQANYRTSYKWKCTSGHTWTASITSRLMGARLRAGRTEAECPRCSWRVRGRKKREYAVPDYLRADWAEEVPIEEASRKMRCRFIHRGSQHGETPCGKEWTAFLFARIGKMKTGCPFCRKRPTGRPRKSRPAESQTEAPKGKNP